MRRKALFFAVFFASGWSCHAQTSDLTLPPEMRSEPQKSTSSAAVPTPKTSHNSRQVPRATAARQVPASPTDAGEHRKGTSEEERLGLVTKWNANNTSEVSTRATSGLSEVNKNHDGEAAGTGAQVGFKYKF